MPIRTYRAARTAESNQPYTYGPVVRMSEDRPERTSAFYFWFCSWCDRLPQTPPTFKA